MLTSATRAMVSSLLLNSVTTPELKAGDKVEVYVENQEDKARSARSFSQEGSPPEELGEYQTRHWRTTRLSRVTSRAALKGGMIVDVFGIEAFLPGSQIDVHPIRDYDVFVGKTMEFKVVKINQEFRNVVVSHKALIEAELEQAA